MINPCQDPDSGHLANPARVRAIAQVTQRLNVRIQGHQVLGLVESERFQKSFGVP